MIELLILLALLAVAALLLRQQTSKPPPVDPDPEQIFRAATELHKIRRRLDGALARSEMRSESARVSREIASALNDEEPSSE